MLIKLPSPIIAHIPIPDWDLPDIVARRLLKEYLPFVPKDFYSYSGKTLYNWTLDMVGSPMSNNYIYQNSKKGKLPITFMPATSTSLRFQFTSNIKKRPRSEDSEPAFPAQKFKTDTSYPRHIKIASRCRWPSRSAISIFVYRSLFSLPWIRLTRFWWSFLTSFCFIYFRNFISFISWLLVTWFVNAKFSCFFIYTVVLFLFFSSAVTHVINN